MFHHVNHPRRAAVIGAVAIGSLLTAACGSSGDDNASVIPAPATDPAANAATTTTTATTATTDPTATTDAETDASAEVSTDDGSEPGGLDAVAAATVQIVAQGTFVDPEFGAYEGAGTGSGFVIRADGIAVTNNHVVGGAGLIQVYVAGEDQPRNAKVLGVSECSDLAVIDIGGADLPAISWFDGSPQPGLEIYAAGFPLSDPEYTLTRGIVSKANASGETGWASVDHVIEHDASIQPGNSGGPLVTADGQVVGINYATSTRTNTDQFSAIEAGDAKAIIDQLTEGSDVDSLGINGQIVVSDDGSLTGLWVSGVTSGSPADLAGVEPGDIVTRLEGVTVGADGTMRDYCDVMRTHSADDVLAVEVVRYATQEVLTGQFNGEYLFPAFSFADTFEDQSADGAAYTEYVSVNDDSGTLTVSVPAAWADVDGAPIDIDGVSSPSIVASSDVAAFNADWDVPGVQFVASTALAGFAADDLLDLAAPDACTSEGRENYDDGAFTGRFETLSDCGGTGATSIVVAAERADGSVGVLVVVQIVTDADLVALDEVLRSFNTVG